MNRFTGLPIISMPKGFEKIAERKNIKMAKKKEHVQSRGNLIIKCKNKNRNYYSKQNYWGKVKIPMASSKWDENSSMGDHFKISSHSLLPAFSDADKSQLSFSDMGIDKRILENLKLNQFTTPTNIQRMSIPHIMQGCNTLLSAETGNGKTHTYLIPLVNQLLKRRNLYDPEEEINHPKSIIILPSRELVAQTKRMALQLIRGLKLTVNAEIGGGMLKERAYYPTATRPDILIGSFGTISKLFTFGLYKPGLVNHVILDEIDTLLDDSFSYKLKNFLQKFSIRLCPSGDKYEPAVDSGVQLTCAGATFSELCSFKLFEMVDNRSLVHIKTENLHKLPSHMSHSFVRVGRENRDEYLLLKVKSLMAKKKSVLIFTNSSGNAAFLHTLLTQLGIECGILSSSVQRQLRVQYYTRFRNGSLRCLVCTDLASRGLNTVNAHCVINYTMSPFMSDYIHRCGRVGRVGSPKGAEVISYVRPYNRDLVRDIEKSVRIGTELPDVNANIKKHYNDLYPENPYEPV